MALLTIADLEQASGTTIESQDYPKYQWYIDVVTAYLEDYTGESYSEVIEETVICRSNRFGTIQFPSLNSVLQVEVHDNWLGTYSELTSGNYSFDGIDTLYGLEPFSTYRVTVSYGWDVPPTTVQGIAVDLVMAGSGLLPGAAGGLSKYRVGDVEESYGVAGSGSAALVTLTSVQAKALKAHSSRTTTWRL